MNYIHKQRFILTSLCLVVLALAIGLILYALNHNLNVFLTPNQIAANTPVDYRFRLGGMVKQGSVQHASSDLSVNFVVTDYKKEILVRYQGILPDLFREGKGVIVEGRLSKDHIMIASQVLAKHDENYMPATVYKEMRANNAKT